MNSVDPGILKPREAATTLDEIERAVARLNLIALIDASGRSGNLFFLTIFDGHPEVAGCPLVQYTYSYILTAFGDANLIDAREAHRFLTQSSYFRLLYNDPVGAGGDLITRMGGDVSAPLDRPALRGFVDDYFAQRRQVTRRELVLAPILAYAAATGADLARIKYAIVGDAISLRQEHVTIGFSGRIIDAVVTDFPEARIVRLVRDPRATFASPRHQFVNSLGNMYAITPRTYVRRWIELLRADLRPDNGCVYLYWLIYLRQADAAVIRQFERHKRRFTTVRNEDLNTDFPSTMRRLAAWIGLEYREDWQSADFVPTIMGQPWAGTGAYNSRYQRAVHGPLANDPDEVASRAVGPNLHVTRRWRTRLNKREIELIEHLFRDEIEELGYEVLFDRRGRSDLACLLRTALLPFEGEMPKITWLKQGWTLGWAEFCKRLFYAVSFGPFYIGSRVLLFDFVLRRELFRPKTRPNVVISP